MTAGRPLEYFVGVVQELRKLPKETEWVEFKVSKAERIEDSVVPTQVRPQVKPRPGINSSISHASNSRFAFEAAIGAPAKSEVNELASSP